jgi:DNA polymerase-1
MRQNSQNLKRKVPVPPVEWCDEKWVENKFGVPPDKIIDLLGLMGDSVDNIPGAPGIGEKGALKLVLEFGSAIEAMDNADKVSHKTYRESLQNNREIIMQSLELATIHCEVPVKLDLKSLEQCEPDRKLAYELFRELEFKALTNEFADKQGLFDVRPAAEGGGPVVEPEYSVIATREELDILIRRLFEAERWSFQVNDANSNEKLSCFHKQAPHGVAIALGGGESFYVDIDNFDEGRDAAVKPLSDILTNGFLEKTVHDAKRNLGALLTLGIHPEAVKDDTMIAAYLLDPTRSNYPVDHLAQVYLDVDAARTIADGFEEHSFRAAENADFAARLAPVLRNKIVENELERVYTEIELPLVPVLAGIELAGMKVDGDSLNKFSEFISKELETLREKIYAIAGREFNIGSPKQVGEVFGELNIASGRPPRRDRSRQATMCSSSSPRPTRSPSTSSTIARWTSSRRPMPTLCRR